MFVTNVEMPLFSKSIVRMVETHKHSRQLKLEMAQLLDHKSLTALASMLKPKDDGDESDEDNSNSQSNNNIGPGDVGPKKKTSTTGASHAKIVNSKNIWEAEEISENAYCDDIHDPRPQPEYEIVYKQAVSAEEMFLGMGNRTAATASCEDMVVRISLPGTQMSEVELDIKPKYLDCRTPKHKLGLHLPHVVSEKMTKAQFDKQKEVLVVTLRLNREYDFMNF